MDCRIGCAACCIAASLTQPFYGMPEGKKSGVRCVHLDASNRCKIFTDPRRPKACADFRAEEAICGDSFEQAYSNLIALEEITLPSKV